MTQTIDVGKQIESSYTTYSLKVVQERAIPDCYDGMKPSQRRLIYAMYDLGLTHKSGFKKSARILGECLGKYHPYGDISLYEALVRVAQDFTTRYPLVDGQGNWGTEEYPAAAHRYTEARLTAVGELMLQDIHSDTVDFEPNFDGSTREPVRLPSPLPSLLLNGASGIAVGLSTNIPSHNLANVIDCLVGEILLPEITSTELLILLKGPDFCKGGIICDENLHEVYTTGKGSIRVKAVAHCERRVNDPHKYIVITELGVLDKVKVLEKLAVVLEERRVPAIRSVEDESRGKDTRIVIQIKQSDTTKLDVLWKKIVRSVGLIGTFKANMIGLIDERPHELNLKMMVSHWLNNRVIVVDRFFKFKLDKLAREIQTTQTYLLVYKNKSKILRLISNAESETEINDGLAQFGFDQQQIEQVLNTPLRKLSKLSENKLKEEYKKQLALQKEYQAVIRNEESIKDYIREELVRLKDKYSDDNRSTIVDQTAFENYDLQVVKIK